MWAGGLGKIPRMPPGDAVQAAGGGVLGRQKCDHRITQQLQLSLGKNWARNARRPLKMTLLTAFTNLNECAERIVDRDAGLLQPGQNAMHPAVTSPGFVGAMCNETRGLILKVCGLR